jgi:phosphatidylinositol glycan class S
VEFGSQPCLTFQIALPSASSAFLIPQWGGVVLLNPPEDFTDKFYLTSTHLNPVFSAFASQFLALLGIPGLAGNVQSPEIVTSWQFDALIRRRTLENTHNSQETLRSIVQLVDKIQSMPIAENVRGNISDTLFALNMVCPARRIVARLPFPYNVL